jgi:solute:Na+ symporter, SSS family
VEDPGLGYVRIMVDILPPGLRGLMLASFAAAYMSTVATQMNWGSSYLTNDLYRRFIKRDASERHYVMASRVAVCLTVALSLIATYYMDQVSKAWELLLMLGAGTGLVYILRWYWWRINAWSEVSAMASAFVVSLTLRQVGKSVPAFDTARPEGFALVLITTTVLTTITWLATTLLTSPEKEAVLRKFYLRVRPAGPGWAPLARATGVQGAKGEIARNLWFWLLGVVFVYSIMFATGALLFDQRRDLLIFGTTMIVSGAFLFIGLSREPAPEEGIQEAA